MHIEQKHHVDNVNKHIIESMFLLKGQQSSKNDVLNNRKLLQYLKKFKMKSY